MPKYIIITCLLFFGLTIDATAQYGFSHEVGAIVGPTAFQSDYGERHDFKTNSGNTGFGKRIKRGLRISLYA